MLISLTPIKLIEAGEINRIDSFDLIPFDSADDDIVDSSNPGGGEDTSLFGGSNDAQDSFFNTDRQESMQP